MDNIFVQLAIILGLASALGYISVRLKLPLLIAYLTGGLLLAVTSFFDVHSSEVLHFLPDIGIAFVLFLVGMELDLRELKQVGKPVLVAGTLQIIITTIAGSTIAKLLGFGDMESWYLGVGLSFSSTILVIKMLLDKKDITALYGKLAIGILLLEDLLAVLILLFLTVSTSVLGLGYQQAFPLITLLLKALGLFGLALFLHRYLLPTVFKAVARQAELLFLTALAWCFIYVALAKVLGFSEVIGAFLAGVTLASSPYHYQIQGKVKPLRDFFVTLFFVYLGTQVNIANLNKVLPITIIFTLYTLILKPTIFMLIFGAFGFRRHTMFKTAISISHISEFSLIMILVGLKNNLVSQDALTAIALSGVVSMIIASVMISRSNDFYRKLKPLIGFFERKNYHNELENAHSLSELKDHVVVIGGHRVGGELVKYFKRQKVPYVVLDFNPQHIDKLIKEDINVIYGDVGDPDVLDEINLVEAKMVISTVQDLGDGLLLIEELKSRGVDKIPIIVRAATTTEAEILYREGADLVLIPAIITGDYLLGVIKDHLNDKSYFRERARIEQEKLERKTLAWE
jgi:Kef-type K+ transport system membrane component KefB/Trk K+ transport system NAD-binding subunit